MTKRTIALYKVPKMMPGQPHIIYDQSITDITERREKAISFKTALGCAQFLGFAHQKELKRYTSPEAIRTRKTYTVKKTGKTYTIRKANKNNLSK